ncbi:MAG: hypothetical protein JWM43_3908 [Acidobacteriaceae bacterium]|nr:hypothetical protein [Acidobacteriaceae bacterium]
MLARRKVGGCSLIDDFERALIIGIVPSPDAGGRGNTPPVPPVTTKPLGASGRVRLWLRWMFLGRTT